jgi:hypothetical protein
MKWKPRKLTRAAKQETQETQTMTQDTTLSATEKHPTEPAATAAPVVAAPSTTSTKPTGPTKYRYRHVFTVTRRCEEKQTLGEIRDDMNMMADETGEYLYGGVGTHEKIDVATEIWDEPNKRWIPMT